jgi:hypothetical protein
MGKKILDNCSSANEQLKIISHKSLLQNSRGSFISIPKVQMDDQHMIVEAERGHTPQSDVT